MTDGESVLPNRRLFVAVVPDEPVRSALQASVEALEGHLAKGKPTWRWNLHLTLAFLGMRSEVETSAALDAMRAAALGCGPLDLELGGLGRFSARGGAIVWRGLAHSEPLSCLRARLVRELSLRAIAVDPGPFRAHVTLARGVRVRADQTDDATANVGAEACPDEGRYAALDALLARLEPELPHVPWRVDAMSLMWSHRVDDRLRYDEIGRVGLSALSDTRNSTPGIAG